MNRTEILSVAESHGVRVVAGSLDGTPDALVSLVQAVIEIATLDDLRQSDAWIFYAARDQQSVIGDTVDG
ncbi:MAG: hypothetical protein JSS57_03045 [Proteobacteria bacterium]|nr:hypothetical protein [Pseudomonadota bacterium]